MTPRRVKRLVKVGSVPVGGGAPVSVQTMLADDPHDVDAIIKHIDQCARVGADIVRLALPDMAAVDALRHIKKRSLLPIVSDVHFDYRIALAAIDAGTDALRINPGNIGDKENVRLVARAAQERNIPIRIGVNSGSLERGESLVSSALSHFKILESEGFKDIVLSVKASNAIETIEAYRELHSIVDCPLHIGLTEAGTFMRGSVHSSVAMGVLLSEGIGDTIRVSLTDSPEKEVMVGLEILRALGLAKPCVSISSCPTCGRTKVALKKVADDVEAAIMQNFPGGIVSRPIRVAVMGCVVNGPGEAKGSDVALCGGEGRFILYIHGKPVRSVVQEEAAQAVVDEIVSLLK